MRLATFNVWNSDCGMPERTNQIARQIKSVNADIICLQEIKSKQHHNELADMCGYRFSIFFNHEDEEEGLSILSKFELTNTNYIKGATIAIFSCNNNTFTLANIHLSWNSALKREHDITEIETFINAASADYKFMLGDFNCSVHSSVQEFLLGQRSLMGKEANPYWYDLSESYSANHKVLPELTLDFQNNSRWNGKNTIEVNQRFDRIFLQNTYPNELPTLIDCKIFGKDVSDITGLAASDHYGVYVDVDFSRTGDKL